MSLDMYLYHTTLIRNSASENCYQEKVESHPKISLHYTGKELQYTLPEKDTFPTDLDQGKFFTINCHCDYASSSRFGDVFLRYKVLKPMKLLDCRNREYDPPTAKELQSYDGYIGIEDCIEIYLKSPKEFVDPEFKIISFDTHSNKEVCPYINQVPSFVHLE